LKRNNQPDLSTFDWRSNTQETVAGDHQANYETQQRSKNKTAIVKKETFSPVTYMNAKMILREYKSKQSDVRLRPFRYSTQVNLPETRPTSPVTFNRQKD
jgi:hypothetical protein